MSNQTCNLLQPLFLFQCVLGLLGRAMGKKIMVILFVMLRMVRPALMLHRALVVPCIC